MARFLPGEARVTGRKGGHGDGGREGRGGGVAGLTGAGPSIVGVSGAMRARDVSRIRPADEERAERTVVVRRRAPDRPEAEPT
jgi:hypothetical protein